MNIFKALCYGVVLWIASFVITSIFVVFNVFDNLIIKVADAMIVGFIALAMVVYLRPKNIGISVIYGIIWVTIALSLDILLLWRFGNLAYLDWSTWIELVLILVAVILGYFSLENGYDETKEKKEPEPPQDIKF